MKPILRASNWVIIFITSFINIYAAMTPAPTATPEPALTAAAVATTVITPDPAVAGPAATATATPSTTPGASTAPAKITPSTQKKDVKLGKDYREIMAERQQKVKAQQQRMKQAHQQSVAARAAEVTGPVPQQSIQQYYQGQQNAKITEQYGASSPQSVSALQAQDYAGVQTSVPKKEPLKKSSTKTTATTKQTVDQKTAQSKQPGVIQQDAAAVHKKAQVQKKKVFKGRLPAQRMQRKPWRPAVRKRKTTQAAPAKAAAQSALKPATQATGIKPLPVSK